MSNAVIGAMGVACLIFGFAMLCAAIWEWRRHPFIVRRTVRGMPPTITWEVWTRGWYRRRIGDFPSQSAAYRYVEMCEKVHQP